MILNERHNCKYNHAFINTICSKSKRNYYLCYFRLTCVNNDTQEASHLVITTGVGKNAQAHL